MRRKLAALGLTAGLLGGGAAGLVLGAPDISGAQSGADSATTTPAPAAGTVTTAPDWVGQALAPLVADGTITQAQADAVTAALAAARPERGVRTGHMFGDLDAAASAIGIDGSALREALASGQTLAQVAEANGADPQVVIDALVAAMRTHVADDVAAGRLTQAQADQILADVESHVTDLVNGTLPAGPRPGDLPGGPPPGAMMWGFGGPGGTPPASGSTGGAGSSSATTSQATSYST
jgi:hypothetical protein